MVKQAIRSRRQTKRILFFVSSMNAGGAERVAATLANAWADQGHTVCLVLTHLGSSTSFYALDPRVQCVPLSSWLAKGARPEIMRKWRAIRAVYQSFHPDVVLSFLTNVNVNVLWALRGVSTPIIVSERTHPLHSQSARGFRWLRQRLYRHATRIVLQTERAAQDFGAVFSHPQLLTVIPNPLPAALLNYAPITWASKATHPQIIALGRLAAVKRFDVLIEAFAQLPPEFTHWHLIIYGEGPQRAALEQSIADLGLLSRAHLPGQTTTPWEQLQQADLFVLCSAYEGFPNALLEAMYLGLPCVTVDCPSGPAELSKQGEVARLLPHNVSANELGRALAALLADESERRALGQQAHSSVKARYHLDKVLNQWEALFDQVTQ